MKQRLGRIFIGAGIICLVWPEVLNKMKIDVIQKQLQEYWPVYLIVIGYFFSHANSRKKSHR